MSFPVLSEKAVMGCALDHSCTAAPITSVANGNTLSAPLSVKIH